ncbi:flagellar fliL protein [Asticcacaulis biprosthecium C19]|uniref:Flagellar protein FliL n=1 Tax=Asticcacaulis biprosthecium C19 TaxID=715226 RepID=F4QPD5_9CAUL|nr:flagellar basal body-associated FliL family protein [Asticcacaulis biprosthecium]EGF91193.1 flagellar fliL protein [Asticcacaulis biprosthecium C19]
MAKKEKKKEEPPVDGGDGEDKPKKKGLPIMLIAIAGGAVLLLGGGGAGAYFMFLAPKPAADAAHGDAAAKDGHGEKKEKKKEEKGGHGGGHGKGEAKVDPKTQPVLSEGPDGTTYLTLPDTVANIQSADGRSSYLKLKLTFECADEETADMVKENLPRVNDILQGFIRELRPEDLKGSAGNHQLRLEILRRINLVLAPHKINAVLIEQMLIT